MKSNGCNEDGWDLFEQQTKEEFEYYAVRRGYDVTRDSEYSFFYADKRTEDAWEMYHKGHVSGRVWSENIVTSEKQTLLDFLAWARYTRSVQLQEMPEWTEDYWCIDEEQLVEDYLETLKEIV